MAYRTLSAILRGKWLIEKKFAISQLPLVQTMLEGKSVHLVSDKQTDNPYYTNLSDHYGEKPLIALVGTGSTFKAVRYKSFDEAPEGSIALIPVTGPIMKYGGECGEPGSTHMTDWVKQASNSSKISGIIIRIDSPGGMVDGTATLAQAIKTSGKPTVAFVDDGLMASAAMWIGSATDEIFASQPTDMIGSIGVYTTLYDFEEWFKQRGIKVHEVYAPQSTEKNLDYKKGLEGDYSLIENDIKFICDEFIDTVKSNRGSRINTQSGDPFKGALYFAQEATQIGLIDGIKSFDEVVSHLEGKIKSKSQIESSKPANQNSENMFGSKFKSISALKGKKADEISAEEIAAANAELVEEGVTGVVIGTDQSKVVADLQNQLTAAQSRNTEMEDSISKLQEEIAFLGKQPGAAPSAPKKETESAENPQAESFESFGHNKQALDEVKKLS